MASDDTEGVDQGDERRRTKRRGVLKAAATAGVMIPTLSGLSGAASGGRRQRLATDAGPAATQETDDGWCPPCIDRLAGYNALSLDDPLPEELPDPDHTVELRVDDADVVFPEECDSPDVPPTGIDPTEEGTVEDAADDAFPDFYFDPVGLRVRPGDVVSFRNVGADLHTITAWSSRFDLQQRIPEDAPPFGSPVIMPGEGWLYRFPEAGVYDIICLPHFELGMVMRVVVVPEGADPPEAPPVDTESTPPVAAAVIGASELASENIVQHGTVAWSDLRGSVPSFDPSELFGE